MNNISVPDDRKGLDPGSDLFLKEEGSGNFYCVTVFSELGRGMGCIVYKGILHKLVEGNPLDSTVIIKELYPKGLGIKRKSQEEAELVIPVESIDEYNVFRERFGKRFIRFSEYAREGYRSLPEVFFYGSSNNTVYAFLCPVKGRLLSEADHNAMSLNRTAAVMEALCRSLKGIHIKEKLCLDLKPGNILYDMEEGDLQAIVYIIDFDSVQKLSDVRQGAGYYPFTFSWSPSEQIVAEGETGYKDSSLLGYHTDIYSLGAVLFFLLTGQAPDETDVNAIKTGTFAWKERSPAFRSAPGEAVNLIQNMEKRMLEPDPLIRRESFKNCLSVRELEKEFAKVYGLTVGDDAHFAPVHEKLTAVEEEVRRLREAVEELKELLTVN